MLFEYSEDNLESIHYVWGENRWFY
jgi:hypothetical protein